MFLLYLPVVWRSFWVHDCQEHMNLPGDVKITNEVKIIHSSGVFVFLTAIKWFLHGSFFLHLTQKSLIMSCTVLYDLGHVSHETSSVCPGVTEGPGLLSFLSDSFITHLWLLLSPHQNNAVPEWISMSFTLGGTLSLLCQDSSEEGMI